MIDDFYTYLDNVTSPEKSLIYKEACDILVGVNPGVYGLMILTHYDSVDQNDTDVFLLRFESILINSMCTELSEFGIYLTEEFSLEGYIPELMCLLKGIYGVEEYQDPEELLLLIDSLTNTRELIGEIVRSVVSTNIDIDKIMDIVEISPSLVKRMSEVLSDKIAVPMEDDFVLNTAGVERLNKWLEIYPSVYISKMLSDGLRAGSPFDTYLNYMYNYLDQEPEPEVVARTLVLMAVAANIPNDKIKDVLVPALEQIFIDGMRILKVSRIINNWVMVDD